jgi:hypothetical protein
MHGNRFVDSEVVNVHCEVERMVEAVHCGTGKDNQWVL